MTSPLTCVCPHTPGIALTLYLNVTISLPTVHFSLPLTARPFVPWSSPFRQPQGNYTNMNEWPDYKKLLITDQSPRVNIVSDCFGICRLCQPLELTCGSTHPVLELGHQGWITLLGKNVENG